MRHDVFRMNENYVRHDFAWWGFGRCQLDHTMHGFRFWGPSTHVWINSYRACPSWLAIETLACAGWLTGDVRRAPRVAWCGSIAEPRWSWRFRVWRAYVGGRTPQWLRRVMERRDERSWEMEVAAYDEYCADQEKRRDQ